MWNRKEAHKWYSNEIWVYLPSAISYEGNFNDGYVDAHLATEVIAIFHILPILFYEENSKPNWYILVICHI